MNTTPVSNPELLSPQVIRATDGECQEFFGESRRLVLTEQQTGGVFALSHRVVAFVDGSNLRADERCGEVTRTHHEMFFVQSGVFDFCLNGRTERLSEGDFLFAPSQVSHLYSCRNCEGGVLLAWSVPAGESAAAARVVRAGEGEWLEAFGDRGRVLVGSEEVGGQFCLADALTPPLSGPPLHLHTREDETFAILAGRIEFLLGDARVQVSAGDVVFAPRGVPHTFRVLSGEPARALMIATPGGFDHFFHQAARLFERGQAAPHSVVELAQSHGIRFLPPEA